MSGLVLALLVVLASLGLITLAAVVMVTLAPSRRGSGGWRVADVDTDHSTKD